MLPVPLTQRSLDHKHLPQCYPYHLHNVFSLSVRVLADDSPSRGVHGASWESQPMNWWCGHVTRCSTWVASHARPATGHWPRGRSSGFETTSFTVARTMSSFSKGTTFPVSAPEWVTPDTHPTQTGLFHSITGWEASKKAGPGRGRVRYRTVMDVPIWVSVFLSYSFLLFFPPPSFFLHFSGLLFECVIIFVAVVVMFVFHWCVCVCVWINYWCP